MHVIAAKAVAFKEALEPGFKDYQRQIVANAKSMAERLASHGYHIVSGGTDTHLMLVSFIDKGITGKAVEQALDRARITVNKNTVPFDPQKPLVTSGIRIGTPAITTRGMKEPEMRTIADLIHRVISNLGDASVEQAVASDVLALCKRFPLYARRLEGE
jgi:glycine hydroxymethyltransferase